VGARAEWVKLLIDECTLEVERQLCKYREGLDGMLFGVGVGSGTDCKEDSTWDCIGDASSASSSAAASSYQKGANANNTDSDDGMLRPLCSYLRLHHARHVAPDRLRDQTSQMFQQLGRGENPHLLVVAFYSPKGPVHDALESFTSSLLKICWECRLGGLGFQSLESRPADNVTYRVAFGSEQASALDSFLLSYPAMVTEDGKLLAQGEVFSPDS
jgi:hypothetical protein